MYWNLKKRSQLTFKNLLRSFPRTTTRWWHLSFPYIIRGLPSHLSRLSMFLHTNDRWCAGVSRITAAGRGKPRRIAGYYWRKHDFAHKRAVCAKTKQKLISGVCCQNNWCAAKFSNPIKIIKKRKTIRTHKFKIDKRIRLIIRP